MAPTGITSEFSAFQLSGLDDEQLVAYARAGNASAAEFLVGKYRSFVEYKARSYFLAGAEHEDVVQEGMLGLYKAIRDFREIGRASCRERV